MSVAGDHPRACGAHQITSSRQRHAMGSSPRMRGSPRPSPASCSHRGIIPAHAGLTTTRPSVSLTARDHPRACGAHIKGRLDGSVTSGSSPRMRGSHMPATWISSAKGIIPAHAGLTSSRAASASWRRDHPRACGAHQDGHGTTCMSTGSSPRMRGSPHHALSEDREFRIIPAHAGLTVW